MGFMPRPTVRTLASSASAASLARVSLRFAKGRVTPGDGPPPSPLLKKGVKVDGLVKAGVVDWRCYFNPLRTRSWTKGRCREGEIVSVLGLRLVGCADETTSN